MYHLGIKLNHVAVHLKLIHCKSTIFEKIKKKKKH